MLYLLYSVLDSKGFLKVKFGVWCIFGGVSVTNEFVFLVSFEGDQIIGSCYFGRGLKLPRFSKTTGFLGFMRATLGSGVS